jgi:signal transduction histidine kinase
MRSFIMALSMLSLLLIVPAKAQKKVADDALATRYTLEAIVRITATGLGGLMESVKDPQEQIDLINRYIQPVRFFQDRSGYFFVYDINGKCVAHATEPELVGKQLLDIRDSMGQYPIREFIAVAKKGGGFVEYWWKKPMVEGEQDKIGYATLIPNTKFFIGSGIYFSSLR